jgi:hypothetical protein
MVLSTLRALHPRRQRRLDHRDCPINIQVLTRGLRLRFSQPPRLFHLPPGDARCNYSDYCCDYEAEELKT